MRGLPNPGAIARTGLLLMGFSMSLLAQLPESRKLVTMLRRGESSTSYDFVSWAVNNGSTLCMYGLESMVCKL